MDFDTNYKRTWHSEPEKNDGPVLVETEGYLTTEQLINLMIKEGQELRAARAEMVDFESEEEIDIEQPIDPTRVQGFDLADFSNLAQSIKPVSGTGETVAPVPGPNGTEEPQKTEPAPEK